MRYPEEKIKQAIVHPDIAIRNRAISYFAESFSTDTSLMPLVIKAVEEFGRDKETYRLIGAARQLPQTDDTISWVIDELNAEQTGEFENYAYNLSMLLFEADAMLLAPRQDTILKARHFFADLGAPLNDRLQMRSWDAARCWQELEEFCEEGKDERYTNKVDLNYANLVVEALARHGQECEPRIRERLSEKVSDYSHHPMRWLEPLLVRLAGQIRLESMVPLIVDKLIEDGGDLLNEECAEALSRIGTPAVLHAVAEAFPTSEQHFRIYATNPLEHIHSDLAVEISVKLLDREKDDTIRRELVQALLAQFASEGIEIARRFLVGRKLDFSEKGLRAFLLETCALTGERFPEYEEWLATEKAEKEEHWRRIKEFEGDPDRLLLYALGKLTANEVPELTKPKPSLPAPPRLTLPRRPEPNKKIGRNDPCHCGSGKKFKHCCMR